LGSAAVEIVDDRLDRFTEGCRGILLGKAMAGEKALDDGLGDGSGVIHVGGSVVAGARIESARLVSSGRKLDEGMVLAHCDGIGRRSNAQEPLAGIFAGKGESGFDFGVEREIFCVWEIQSAAGRVEFEGALFVALECGGNVVSVAEEEVGGVDEGVVALLCGYGEAAESGFGEGIADSAAL